MDYSFRRSMKKYWMELIGSFFLMLTIGCSVGLTGTSSIPPLAIGGILTVLIYTGGHISGAQYNPAVTIGVWLRGKMDGRDVFPYILSQCAGTVIAAWVVGEFSHMPFNNLVAEFRLHDAIMAEFCFTFLLVFTVLNLTTAKKTEGNQYYGIAIGGVVMAGAFAVGGTVCSGAFNPAVELGLSVMQLAEWNTAWIYIAVNFYAGCVAALVFRLLNPEEH